MATATVDSAVSTHHLHSDSLPLIDLRLLSQSELLSLSLCSSSSSLRPLQNDSDLSTPKIDRSVFNESAGSRKQTFSRLRLAPPRNNFQFVSSSSSMEIHSQTTTTTEQESSQIVSLLKSLFGCDSQEVDVNYDNDLVPVPLQYNDNFYLKPENIPVGIAESVQGKRKRGRPRKDESNLRIESESKAIVACDNVEKEGAMVMVNKDGAVVDVAGLGTVVDQYGVGIAESAPRKRKRGRPRKDESNLRIERESKAIVARDNVEKDGAVVGIAGLGSVADQYGVGIAEVAPGKRKRGRPRKDESNLRLESESKAIVARDNVEEGAMAMVNKDGAVVDIAGLGSVVDPYGEDLRRRTEGMRTEGELLGFLEGLEGEWVSSRKKSRVVNAGEFGGVLPTGWKLMLCVRKKAGCAWLACKRYISPNGQQFVSCEEVSSYLLSLSGLQGASLTNSVHIDSRVNLTPGNAADFSVKEDKNVDEPVHSSAFPISPSSAEVEKQTTSLRIGSCTEVLGGKKYKCHKCTTTFNEPNDLLQHLLSSHQKVPKRLRQAASMTEEAIMIDGKYQCQLCDKVFEERHRFNGHLGNHIKDYLKRVDASGGVTNTQKNSMPTSTGVLSNDLQPIPHDSNGLKISDVQYCEIKSTISAGACKGKQGRAFAVSNDGKVNEASSAVAAKINVSPGAEPALLSNKCNFILKPSDETKVLECTIDGTNNVGMQVSSQSSSHGAFMDQACAVNNNLNQMSTDLVADHNLAKASVSSFNAPAAKQKTFGDCKPSDEAKVLECTIDGTNNVGRQVSLQSSSLGASRDQACAVNYNLNQMSADLVVDDNLENDVSSFNAPANRQKTFGDCNAEDGHLSSKKETMEIPGNLVRKEQLITGHDNSGNVGSDDVIGIKNWKEFVAPSCNNQRDLILNNSNSLLPSTMGETTYERGSKGSSLSSSDEKVHICGSDVINVSKFDELRKSGINDQSIEYGANSTVTIEVVTSKGERSYGNCYAVASTDGACDVEDNSHGTFKSTGNLPCREKGTENTQLNLSCREQSLGFKTDFLNSFPSSENEFRGGSAFDPRSETNIQLHNQSSVLLVPSANTQKFPPTNNGNYNSTVEKLTPYRNPESSLQRPSYYRQTHYDKNSVNGMRMESYKHNEVKRSCNSESHIGFGHGGTKPEMSFSFGAVQESTPKNYPVPPSGYQTTVHTRHYLRGPHGSIMNTQKQTRNSAEGLLSLSSREQPQMVENNLNRDFLGGTHTEPRLEDSKFSRKNELLKDSKFSRKNELLNGFNNQILSNEHPMLDFMWRTDDENDLLRGFVDTSSHVGQTAGGFPACDVMSDKGENAFFGEKFDGTSAFEGLRSGGMGNMEFNFLSSQMDSESNESKTNAFNSGMAQGYGSSVWLEKEALPLLPKMARQHRIMCIYCRNEFQYESGAQTGSMGFTCAACKAKFSSPFNFL